ncbi:acyl-CoA carboxylase epsilon subunit [Streptomyces sp. BPTC-684]|uniref:acyl-CoA carboxylase epsilon subunit n=1 Tax=Streptomyces sp. BPTC-684 TaxID=3043734 RepID=UPI0024B227FA|nr:acyl-CoA carboxylase epsilon subunit [Streptomyces sp. BPTC-684]WHM36963.1 acyl-CoA carboxylase epsilon subunit [Streptomyces sp. BPTC-684]
MIKVVRGNPTPEELAAALAVVRARAAATASASSGAPLPPEEWSTPARIARHPVPRPGPRSWARSYWPS